MSPMAVPNSSYARRTKSPFPVRDPSDPEDASVQIMIRVPFWYHQRLQKIDNTKSVSAICLDLIGRHVSQDKKRARLPRRAS
jgi:hypothetical protein